MGEKTMTDLSLPERIRRAHGRLGPSQQLLAKFVLDRPNEVAFLTSTRLGEQAGVSEATVVRFAMRLGYPGFPEMQQAVRGSLRRALEVSHRTLPSLDDKHIEASVFGRLLQAEQQNLAETAAGLDGDLLDQAVTLLVGARRIHVAGGRTSYAAAYLAWMLLNQVLRKARLVSLASDTLPDQLLEVTANDVFLAFATPRYTRQTIEVCRHARWFGARTIAVTDSLLSPAAEGADVVLPVRYLMPSFFNGNVAAVAIAQALAGGAAERAGHDSSAYLAELEDAYHRWGNTFLESGESLEPIGGGGGGRARSEGRDA